MAARFFAALFKEACAMAASPVSIVPASNSNLRRRPLALTQRRLEANRRNAGRSSGPRTAEGKARVARNAIKHGFFAGQERWTSLQHRDFAEILAGLRDEFKPDGAGEESCVSTIAESYVRMAAMLRYENVAALKHHQQRDRELNQHIATAAPAEAAHLRARREKLRCAGLWRPTIPGPREPSAIIRYTGCLHRTIQHALSELDGSKNMRTGGVSSGRKVRKQTHYSAAPKGAPEPGNRLRAHLLEAMRLQKQTHFEKSPERAMRPSEGPQAARSSVIKNAKTNPLTSTFTGNRHQRRRAKALAAKRRHGGAQL
jgi:hypothetical protein